jgi:hypothetical protein
VDEVFNGILCLKGHGAANIPNMAPLWRRPKVFQRQRAPRSGLQSFEPASRCRRTPCRFVAQCVSIEPTSVDVALSATSARFSILVVIAFVLVRCAAIISQAADRPS